MSEVKSPTVLITGAGGLLGTELINQLKDREYTIYAFTSQKENLSKKYSKHDNILLFNYKDWEQQKIPFEKVTKLINSGFARSSRADALADSIAFINQFISNAVNNGVESVINISSQSVYSQKKSKAVDENAKVEPETLYGMAKYSTELLIENICKTNNVDFTNIRLGSLTGPNFDVRLTNRFVKQAINNEIIKIVGGQQRISYLDVKDAATGLIKLVEQDSAKWKPLYNFGAKDSGTLLEIANLVKSIGEKYISGKVNITIEESDVSHNNNIISELFYKDISWEPTKDLEKIIEELFILKMNG